jgi:TIR domain/NACHT domain
VKVFISYTRDKDEFNTVTEFRQHFANELRQISPGSVVFQDTEQVKPGDRFPERLIQEITTADLLLVLVSPAWLTRKWCRWEFELFAATERDRGLSARVLPVLWVRTDELESPGDDLVAQQLAPIQYDDWRDLRHEDWKNPEVRKRIAKLAERAKAIVTNGPGKLDTTAHSLAMADKDLVPSVSVNSIPDVFKKSLSDWEIWLKGNDPFGAAGRKYSEKLEQLYNTIRILGMEAPVPLRTIYVRVNILEKITARHTASVKDLEAFFQRDKQRFGFKQATKTGLEIINSLQKVIVLGKPGAGKSTFLKFLALLAIDGELATARVPIFVSLKEWSDSRVPLMQFIVTQFDICDFPDALPYVRRLLNNGKCLLLLDGFDEVTGDISTAISQIRDFSNKYPTNQFILSCRIAAYDYVFEHFTEVEMADFEDGEIQTFIDNWFGSGSPKAIRCWNELKDDPAIHELARIPLLLTMLCLAFDEQMTFPTNRAELYHEAVNALLKKWDSSRDIKRQEVYKQLTPRRKEVLLGYVASQTFQRGQYFLPRKMLEAHVRDYIEHLPGAEETTLDLDSEAIVKSIEAQHGLLVERARGIYSFSHLTLQEYFTACHIFEHWSDEGVRDIVAKHLLDSDWREVILLAAAMLSSADQLLMTMRRKISNSATRDVNVLLGQVSRCVKSTTPYSSHVSRVWANCFYIRPSPCAQNSGRTETGHGT